MKTQIEKILLAIVVIGMLTLAMFHSCKNVKEEQKPIEYPAYGLIYDSIDIIDEYNDFCIIRYNLNDTVINIYASFEDMTIMDSILYSMENVDSEELLDSMMMEFSEEIRFKWSDYLKQYVIDIK